MKKLISSVVCLIIVSGLCSCAGTQKAKILQLSEYVDTVTTDNYVLDIFEDYAEIVEYKGTDKELVILDEYESLPVMSIGDYAFKDVSSVKSVTIPSSVLRIGEYAFSSCKNLEEVVFKNGVSEICCNAFENNSKLKSINLPDSLVYLGAMAFFDCSNLENVTVPKGLSDIGAGAFAYTQWIESADEEFVFAGDNVLISYKGADTEVTLPDNTKQVSAFFENYTLKKVICNKGLESIGEMCFSDCNMLEGIELSDTLKRIEKKAFIWCQSLKDVELPSSLTEISDEAFSDCVSLKNITVPSGVKIVGYAVFQRCEALKDITFENSSLKLEEKLFSNKNNNVTVHAKYGSSLEDYCKENGYNFEAV